MVQTKDNQGQKSAANSTLTSSISGLIASSVGKTIVHPVDTIKAKLQVQSNQKNKNTSMNQNARSSLLQQSRILSIANETIRSQGPGGLYRGFAINVLGSIPAAGIYFGSYEFFKNNTLQYHFLQQNPFISYLCGGLFAETMACILFVPIDVIKERRQVQFELKTFNYSNDVDAVRQVLKTEGLRGLYRAYGATVMSFGPFSAFYFLFYEKLKGLFVLNDPQSYLRKTNRQDEESIKASQKSDIGFFQSMLCSMLAGAGASVITNPLDMAKLRLQVQRAGKIGGGVKNEFYYKHLVDGVYKIGRDEGMRSLFNGSFARILFHVPNVAITMSIVELVKPKIQLYLDNRNQ
ncbi:mitochondrial carrier [Stylonychia lemnae]|uniref:Mitochondrial carrier n=1 Tax=Stylonychia lemnae TaxID=5949 RepID=A0A077ZTC2_STYLE|nr:mitochondrial carrier [Stylonychia lemnae]|eukprot:CDW72794.1 mitochondrial carrier [Stylonychia lemnae]